MSPRGRSGRGGTAGLCALAAWLTAIPASAQITNAGVLVGSGGWTGNATHRALLSAHEFSPATGATNASLVTRTGFFLTFTLRPSLDTDGDGLCDEDDGDNDNDGLADTTELRGGGTGEGVSNPQLADSDGDGSNDGDEAAAGTDPGNASSAFRIVEMSRSRGQVAIVWQSREGVAYEVMTDTNPAWLAKGGAVVDTVTASGGTGLWRVAASTSRVDEAGLRRFYRVRRRP
jgi:hypothetical protein